MDHAINQLKEYMNATIEIYQGMDLTRDEVRDEFKAYVDAINSLESYYYGEVKTDLESILSVFKEGE